MAAENAEWKRLRSLLEGERLRALEAFESLIPQVLELLRRARKEGFKVLAEWQLRRRGCVEENPRVPHEALEEAFFSLDDDVATALKRSFDYAKWFHEAVRPRGSIECTGSRVVWSPVRSVCVVVDPFSGPPLPQLIAACAAARAAGVREVYVSIPASRCSRSERRLLLAAAYVCGAEALLVEGASAVVGVALGVEPLPRVERVVGLGDPEVEAAKAVSSGLVGVEVSPRPPVHMLVVGEGVEMELAEADARALASTSRLLVVASWPPEVLKRLRRTLPRNAVAVPVDGVKGAGELVELVKPCFLEVLADEAGDLLPYAYSAGYVVINRPAVSVSYSMGLGACTPSGEALSWTGSFTVYSVLRPVLVTGPRSPHILWHVARILAEASGREVLRESSEAWIEAWERSRVRSGRPLLVRRW